LLIKNRVDFGVALLIAQASGLPIALRSHRVWTSFRNGVLIIRLPRAEEAKRLRSDGRALAFSKF
jgi:hypothetical protein